MPFILEQIVSRPDQSNAEQDFATWLKDILLPRLTLSLQGKLPLEPIKPAAKIAAPIAKKATTESKAAAVVAGAITPPPVSISPEGAAAAAAIRREARVNEDDFEYDDGEAEEAVRIISDSWL
jgi:hypothetical protein